MQKRLAVLYMRYIMLSSCLLNYEIQCTFQFSTHDLGDQYPFNIRQAFYLHTENIPPPPALICYESYMYLFLFMGRIICNKRVATLRILNVYYPRGTTLTTEH